MAAMTKQEIRSELQRLRRILDHYEKLSPAGQKWLVSRLAANISPTSRPAVEPDQG